MPPYVRPGKTFCSAGADVRLAVPEKCCGLTRILAFFDRCGNCGFASSATGSARPQFPGAPRCEL